MVSAPSKRLGYSKHVRRAMVSANRELCVPCEEHVLCHAHSYWMIASLSAFPVVMLGASLSGYATLLSFLAGMAASLVVLLLNVIYEREFWMLDTHWKHRFEDPDFSHRLLVLAGALLLVVQTVFGILLLSAQRDGVAIWRIFLG